MKRITIRVIAPLLVFLLTWSACTIVFWTTTPTNWFYHQKDLKRIHRGVMLFREEIGELPDQDLVNELIARHWNSDEQPIAVRDNPNYELVNFDIETTEFDFIHLWDLPPVYLISDELPDGFGIYSKGDDGISRTGGNDPDYINSWDQQSSSFYARKYRLGKVVRDLSIAGMFGLMSLLVAVRMTRHKVAPDERTEESAGLDQKR